MWIDRIGRRVKLRGLDILQVAAADARGARDEIEQRIRELMPCHPIAWSIRGSNSADFVRIDARNFSILPSVTAD
jgi:hypothetical protein